ncbi:alpha/beta fold hydrolase [Erythrobacter donghaensis]|jgi:pimeloyl-ACP methyl ester carboxylesterase|uniref:alpha/beta fold hydrolase n=1 Tax=Erythrobacter donghaensis TaxID=267135 RepID=UPI00093E8A92|nr:alpha/beta fold hydrolase [Erythrobacter donghaensis]
MPTLTTPNTGIEIFYEEHGDPQAPAMLLVMGLGAQMTLWPDELVAALASEGFRVIRYDNRDIGLSQKMEGQRAPSPAVQVLRKKIGFPAKVPYTLKDMADDGIGVLDALGIDRAHVVGASMGGMIVQLMAIHHAERLMSMTSIMSTTGSGRLPQAEPNAIGALTAPLKGTDEETLVAHGLNIIRNIGTPDSAEFPFDEAYQRERVLANMRRSVYPAGLPRQLAAILDDGDRTKRLGAVRTPTLVLHGEADPLVKLPGGEATAAAIPGARLVTIPGWGHDLPLKLVPRLASEIGSHARGG